MKTVKQLNSWLLEKLSNFFRVFISLIAKILLILCSLKYQIYMCTCVRVSTITFSGSTSSSFIFMLMDCPLLLMIFHRAFKSFYFSFFNNSGKSSRNLKHYLLLRFRTFYSVSEKTDLETDQEGGKEPANRTLEGAASPRGRRPAWPPLGGMVCLPLQ